MKLVPKYRIGAKIKKAQHGEALTARDRLMLSANFDSSNLTTSISDDISFSSQKKSDLNRNRNYWLKEANNQVKAITGQDGYFKSIEDVVKWQKDNGLVGDGKFGKKTNARFKEIFNLTLTNINNAESDRIAYTTDVVNRMNRAADDTHEEINTITRKPLPSIIGGFTFDTSPEAMERYRERLKLILAALLKEYEDRLNNPLATGLDTHEKSYKVF